MVYEVVAFQALRDQLSARRSGSPALTSGITRTGLALAPGLCREPRGEYRELRKPLDATVFIDELCEQMTPLWPAERPAAQDGLPGHR
jgi:hypothetical protein